MSELRQDTTTKEWVILAPERGKRPQTEAKKMPVNELPEWDSGCPFCPGNESKTPSELFRIPLTDPGAPWEVRVVPNRFPALVHEGSSSPVEDFAFFRKRPGFGQHEVIIETPTHNLPISLMPYQQVEKILITYQERYNVLKKDRSLKFITLFKNHGLASGTSLAHPHSQLVATPIAATYFHQKFDVAVDYCYDIGRCLYCDLLNEELGREERIIGQTPQFVVFQPYASRVPWETWIIPKAHFASFGLYPIEHFHELAMVLKDTLYLLYWELSDPAFNYVIDTTTTFDEYAPCYHWHIRILPRTTTIAGFEIGSGIYINPSLPEDTAALMRQAIKACPEDQCLAFK